ncbi:MAG: hypothetical protein GC185_07770 [Alphaproteobacteria bacterium]|nr:hypothetical protein [Alphaproteobacteria bacterium]
MNAFYALWPEGAIIALFAGVWIFLWRLRKHTLETGAQLQRNAEQEKTADDLQKANDARDRLRRDPGYAVRVRARFTRKT